MNKIQDNKLYWATGNYHEFRIIGAAINDICHSGDNTEAVNKWLHIIINQCANDKFQNKPTFNTIQRELRECGAWSEDELMDGLENWKRLIWIAAWDIFDSEHPDCSDPVIDDDIETVADKEYADRIGGHPWSNC